MLTKIDSIFNWLRVLQTCQFITRNKRDLLLVTQNAKHQLEYVSYSVMIYAGKNLSIISNSQYSLLIIILMFSSFMLMCKYEKY